MRLHSGPPASAHYYAHNGNANKMIIILAVTAVFVWDAKNILVFALQKVWINECCKYKIKKKNQKLNKVVALHRERRLKV